METPLKFSAAKYKVWMSGGGDANKIDDLDLPALYIVNQFYFHHTFLVGQSSEIVNMEFPVYYNDQLPSSTFRSPPHREASPVDLSLVRLPDIKEFVLAIPRTILFLLLLNRCINVFPAFRTLVTPLLTLTGLIVLMAQMGCFVPAEMAVIPVRDSLLSRIGTGDDMENNVSTFLMEMREVAQVRACLRAFVPACVRACVHARGVLCVRGWYDSFMCNRWVFVAWETTQ